jgi:hypothetical protein
LALETLTPTTRRNVLVAAAGALAAFIAQAVGRPLPARAEGEAVVVCGEYTTATSVTKIANTTSDDPVIWAESSLGGTAVYASSGSFTGVYGNSTSHYGVYGASGSGTGVRGSAGVAPATSAPAKTGVYGYATQDANARGVTGQSTSGRGLNGVATTGVAVYGIATTGYALRTSGKVRLEKSGGTTTIAAGTKSTTVTPGIDLTPSSAVMGHAAGQRRRHDDGPPGGDQRHRQHVHDLPHRHRNGECQGGLDPAELGLAGSRP